MLDLALRKGVFHMGKTLSERRSLNRRIAGVTMPIIRKRIKWGRNMPCLCGSGLKYKKCCMIGMDNLTISDDNADITSLSEDMQEMIEAQKRGDVKKHG